MDPNTYSAHPTDLPDAVAAEQVLKLRRPMDRLEGHWLKALAAVDARGAAGAEAGIQAPSPPPAGSATVCAWSWSWTACSATAAWAGRRPGGTPGSGGVLAAGL
jgi:hypothetical protein